MRYTLLIVLICVLANLNGMAQTRPDQIFQLDKTSQNAFVDEIGESSITYFLPTDTNRQNSMRILKSRVWKIVFANGDVELINPLPAESVQQARVMVPDRIFTTDKTVVEVKVVNIGASEVEYRRIDAGANAPIYEFPLSKVVKIELANGEVKTFEIPAVSKSNTQNRDSKKTKLEAKEKKEVARKELKPAKLDKVKPPRTPAPDKRFGMTVAFVGSYIYKEAYWQADSNSVGLRQGLGGALSINYKVAKWLAFSLQGGYNQFLSNRTYLTPAQDTLYTAKYSLVTIPAQLGIKIYLAKPVYLGLYGGMNYLLTKFDSYSEYSLETKRFSPTGTAVLGFEPKLGKLKLDIAIQYNYTTVNATTQYAASPAIHIPQFKLGLGF